MAVHRLLAVLHLKPRGSASGKTSTKAQLCVFAGCAAAQHWLAGSSRAHCVVHPVPQVALDGCDVAFASCGAGPAWPLDVQDIGCACL